MEEKIKVFYGNEVEGSMEELNKSKIKQKILELLETQKIEKIEIFYKKRESACKANSNN